MTSLYIYDNIDINDDVNFCVFHEESNHPFSKSYECRITISGIEYRSVEHFYQSQKFKNNHRKIYEQILNANSAKDASLLGVQHHADADVHFDVKKLHIYTRGQKKKFEQHKELRSMLLDSKQKAIICLSKTDTYFGLLQDTQSAQKFVGRNIAGVLLQKIRDELLLGDSDDGDETTAAHEDHKKKEDKTDNCKLIDGDVTHKFQQTYSAIFAPFLLHVAVQLINNHNSTSDATHSSVQLSDYVLHWGGGMTVIRKCCTQRQIHPDDEGCDWDTMIDLCCAATPLAHDVWTQLLQYNNLKVDKDATKNMLRLLQKWKHNGQIHRTYGAYPTAEEQEFYIQDTIPNEVADVLNMAIITDVFKDAFIAMEKYKFAPTSASTVTQPEQASRSSFVGSMWNFVDKTIAEISPMNPMNQ